LKAAKKSSEQEVSLSRTETSIEEHNKRMEVEKKVVDALKKK